MATTTEVPVTSDSQVPLKSKITFPFAEFGSHLVWTTVGTYLLVFYTDVALIAPVVAGNILLLARLLDGLQDLGFGYIAERTKSRWGRFRPYVIFGSPFLSISLMLAFINPVSGNSGKVIWAGFTYVLLCFLYTVVNMSYGSMAGVMTTSSKERLTLNWLRAQGGTISQLLLQFVTPFLLVYFAGSGAIHTEKGYDDRSFLWTMGIFAAVALPMFLITGFFTKERITLTPEQQKIPFKDTVKAVFSNGQLMIIFGFLLTMLMGLFGRIGVMAFYCIYILGDIRLMAPVMLAFQIGTMAGQFIFPPFALKFGKSRMLILSAFISGVILLGIFFFGETSMPLLYALQFLYGLAGFAAPVTLSMIPDAVDDYENKHGVRADGTSYATVSLSTKIAGAFGGAVSLYIIGWFGYDGAAQVQTASATTGINVAANLVPAILCFAAGVFMFFWKLNTARMNEIEAELDIKRAAHAEALAKGLSREEAEAEAERIAEEALGHHHDEK